MKKQLFIFAIAFTLLACNKKQPVDYTLISGNIKNNSVNELLLGKEGIGTIKKIVVNADGTFNDTIKNASGLNILMVAKSSVFLYLDNGMSLNINADEKDFDNSLSITGKGNEISNYLLFKRTKEREYAKFIKLDEDGFKKKIKELNSILSRVIDTMHGIPESYKTAEKRSLNYKYLNKLLFYYSFQKRQSKEPIDFKEPIALKTMDYNNEADYLFSSDYKQLVKKHYKKEIQKIAEKDSIDFGSAGFKVLSKISNATIKNQMLFSVAKRSISKVEDLESYYNQYMKESTDEANNVKITEIYNNLKKLRKGSISPKFINYENNAGGTLSLNDLLNKGKYIYVDIWATWCGPCRAEVPHLKRIEEQYHDKNIEFLSISIDEAKNHDKWKKMIVDDALGGIQLLADNDWKSQFIKDYNINGIPRFILIDPKGNIIDAEAPRPSDSKLISLFNELSI
ncbi:TlpA family protein disulfide reductase [Thalassobellus citreus]|uniref:TlpA family protein disulfide reductase n=1 Tax=Thalassobellus citreus TaxID=3367752 RepID=UPI003787D992